MEWLDRMNDALGYLEANLAGTADMEHAARLACCSVYHFGRMFSYIAGVPLSEYLRRRRMTLAAFDLQNGGRVLDVALRYGYESPTEMCIRDRGWRTPFSFKITPRRPAGLVPRRVERSDRRRPPCAANGAAGPVRR